MVRDESSLNELKQPNAYFLDNADAYPMAGFKGQPEFELFDRKNYNVNHDRELPQMTFMSNTGLSELPPQHNENTINYQQLHPELERWAIFRSLPAIMIWDKQFGDLIKNMNTGQIIVPQFHSIINPPSLLAYYLTLPAWCRNNSLVQNTFYAMEYHQTRTSIRDKELLLNYAASWLRPIDKKLLNVIKEVAAAKKIRLNVELAK